MVRALMVPWMTPAAITEYRSGRVLEYQEQFARGAFQRAERFPNRVRLVWTHDDTFANVLGVGVEVVNDPAGAVGIFRPYQSIAEKVRDALDGSGVSVSFQAKDGTYGTERNGQLVTRRDVHLIHLAAVDQPAYPDARVLAIREQQQEAAEALQRQAESDRMLAQTLAMLKASGHAITPEQEAWLAEHQPE